MAATDERGHVRALLRDAVALLADRHGYAPEENFEYALWDDLQRPEDLRLVSQEEAAVVTGVAMRGDSWVAYDLESGRFQAIDMDSWLMLLDTRGH
jgi:hypothetical protein